MKTLSYWIKERHNGQSTPYYVGSGQMTKKDAKLAGASLAGFNIMHEFKTQDEYEAELLRLKDSGERVLP